MKFKALLYISACLFVVFLIVPPSFSITDETKIYLGGDLNDDSAINVTDAVYLLKYLFDGQQAPVCGLAADADGDRKINITDAVYLLRFLFLGEKPPVLPFVPQQACDILDKQDPNARPPAENVVNPNDPQYAKYFPDGIGGAKIECVDRSRADDISITNDKPECKMPIIIHLDVPAAPENKAGWKHGLYVGCADTSATIYYLGSVDCREAKSDLILFPINSNPEISLLEIYSGSGNDQIVTGKAYNVIIKSSSGNDIIFGRDPAHIVDPGYMSLLYAGPGNDLIFGQGTIDPKAKPNPVIYTILAGDEGSDVIIGGSAEVIYGDSVDTKFTAPTGDDLDIVIAAEMNDKIYGWASRNILSGGPGDNIIYGGYGADIIIGSNNIDFIEGNLGRDIIFGGSGRDHLYGFRADNNPFFDSESVLEAELSDEGDLIFGDLDPAIDLKMFIRLAGSKMEESTVNGQTVKKYGGINTQEVYRMTVNQIQELDAYKKLKDGQYPGEIAGDDDQIYPSCGNDIVLGDGGNDVIVDGRKLNKSALCPHDPDNLLGGSGNDTIWGAEGRDVVYGGSGDDILYGDREDKQLNIIEDENWKDAVCGGSGRDKVFGDTPFLAEGATDILVSGPRPGNNLNNDAEMVCDGGQYSFNPITFCDTSRGYGYQDEDKYVLNGSYWNPGAYFASARPPDYNDYYGFDPKSGIVKYCRDNWDNEGEKCMMTHDQDTWGPRMFFEVYEEHPLVLPFQGDNIPEDYRDTPSDSPTAGGLVLPDCGLYGPSGTIRHDGGYTECKEEEKDICCICTNNCKPGWTPICIPEGASSCGQIGQDEAENNEIPATWLQAGIKKCNMPIYQK